MPGLFDDLPFTIRRVKISGTVNLTGDQIEAVRMGRAVELLVSAVVETRSYKRDKDGVRESITIVPISSEVQAVGTVIVDASQLPAGSDAEPE